MARIYTRKETNRLVLDFSFKGKRCREQTSLPDTAANRKRVKGLLDRIEAEITLGTFDYAKHFPHSPRAEKFKAMQLHSRHLDTPLFAGFAETWFGEMIVQWRKSHSDTVRLTLSTYLLPRFGEREVGRITKADILEFRASLAKVTTRSNKGLSSSRINHIMTPLRMILNEAANRYNFSSPYQGIKSLRVPRTDVEPFTLEEVRSI
ncbi:integrase, partial [Thalassospira xiamenensis]